MVKSSVRKQLVVGGSESQSLQERLEALEREKNAPTSSAQTISKGFVPRTEETDREKEKARTSWDRSMLLKVDDNDMQVKIYNDLARGPNNNQDRPTKFGLGFGSDGPGASTAPVTAVGTMRFVASASNASETAAAAGGQASAPGASPDGWTGPHLSPDGHQYWHNPGLGVSSWEPPGAQKAKEPSAAPAAAATAATGQQGDWTGPHLAPSGHSYWYNTRTGLSEWATTGGEWTAAAAVVPLSAPSHAKPGCTVSVAGIPPDFQDADVRDLFGTYGSVLSLQLDRGSFSAGTEPKRGLLTFEGSVGAQAAAKALHGKKMRQHTLSVHVVLPTAGGSGGPMPTAHKESVRRAPY